MCRTVEEDIEAVLKSAAHIHTTNKHRILNPTSALPSSKANLRAGIKERIRQLAAAYVSLATFVDDDELAFMEENPRHERTRAVYDRVIRSITKAERDMTYFRPLRLNKKLKKI